MFEAALPLYFSISLNDFIKSGFDSIVASERIVSSVTLVGRTSVFLGRA